MTTNTTTNTPNITEFAGTDNSANRHIAFGGDTDTVNTAKANHRVDAGLSQGTTGSIDMDAFTSKVGKAIKKATPSADVANVIFGMTGEMVSPKGYTIGFITVGVAEAIRSIYTFAPKEQENGTDTFWGAGKLKSAIKNALTIERLKINSVNKLTVARNKFDKDSAEYKQADYDIKNYKKAARQLYPSNAFKQLIIMWNNISGAMPWDVNTDVTDYNSGIIENHIDYIATAIVTVLLKDKILIQEKVTTKNKDGKKTIHKVPVINPDVINGWFVDELVRVGNSNRGMILTEAPLMIDGDSMTLPTKSVISTKGVQVVSPKGGHGDMTESIACLNIINQTKRLINQDYVDVAQAIHNATTPAKVSKEEMAKLSKIEKSRAAVSNKEIDIKNKQFKDAMKLAAQLNGMFYWSTYNKEWRGRYNDSITALSSHTGTVAKAFLILEPAPAHIPSLMDNIGKMLNDIKGNNMEKARVAMRLHTVEGYEAHIKESVSEIRDGSVTKWVRDNVDMKMVAQYYAAAIDLVGAWSNPNHQSGIVIPTDQNCSAIGFAGSFAKDMDTVATVNLSAATVRQDIYEAGADFINKKYAKQRDIQEVISDTIRADNGKASITAAVSYIIKHRKNINRKLMKNGFMTHFYNSKAGSVKTAAKKILLAAGFSNQLAISILGDLIVRTRQEMLVKPEGLLKLLTFMAGNAIASRTDVKNLNEFTVNKWRDEYLQGQDGVKLKGQGVISWSLADGSKVHNQYNREGTSKGRTLSDAKDVNKQVNGIAANLTHSWDSCLMTKVVNKMNVPLVPIHDSWGVTSNNYDRLQVVVREEFRELMEHNTIVRDLVAENAHMFTDSDLVIINEMMEKILIDEKEFTLAGMESNEWCHS